MKTIKVLLVILLALLLSVTFVACDDPDPVAPEYKPYTFVFASNGDGTCSIVDIYIDADDVQEYTLVIPETSPDGDTVTAIQCHNFFHNKDEHLVPLILTTEAYERMLSKIPESKKEIHNYHRLLAYYMPIRENSPLFPYVEGYMLDTAASESNVKMLSEDLADLSDGTYTYEDKFNDHNEILAIAREHLTGTDLAAITSTIKSHWSKNMTGLRIPATVTEICTGAFSECSDLTKITVSEENPVYYSANNCIIRKEDKMLIRGCKTSTISADVQYIGPLAFDFCFGLTDFTIPDSVNGIGGGAFYHCTSLKTIRMPEQMEYIDGLVSLDGKELDFGAFEGCESLESINVPSGVTDLTNAFRYCINLKNVTIPDGVLSVEFTFEGCTSLKNVTLPDTVKHVCSTFQGCTNLETAFIPDGVMMSGIPNVFNNCPSLRSVSFPNIAQPLYYTIFEGCVSLTEITFRGTMAEWESIVKHVQSDKAWNNDVPATVVHCSDGDVPIQ